MKQIPLTGKSSADQFFPVNFYWQAQAYAGRHGLVGTPGLDLFATIAGSYEIRGMIGTDTYLFVVAKDEVHKIDSGGTSSQLTNTLQTTSGQVFIEKDYDYVVIVDGDTGYYIDISAASTVVEITDLDGKNPTSLTWQDGYFIATSTTDDRFYISNLNDPTVWDALDYASAEWLPDDGVATIASLRMLHIFGEKSLELFYNSGDEDFPFTRLQDGVSPVGCYRAETVTQLEGIVYFLADDLTIRRMKGLQAEVISPMKINEDIASYSTPSTAFAFSYKHNGNLFYVISFPSDEKTWAFNQSTGKWHRWAYYTGTAFTRHRANCYAKCFGKHYVGDYSNGKIYELSETKYTDDGDALVREHTLPAIYSRSNNKIRHNALVLEFKTGVGVASGDGTDPEVMLSYSNDYGRNWNYGLAGAIGQDYGVLGEYNIRVIWRRLGSARNRIYKFRTSDPVETKIIGAYVDTREGRS